MVLPRTLGGLLDDGKIKHGVPKSNMAKFLHRKLEETETLLSTAREKASDMESRARALEAKVPSRDSEKLLWHETNRNRALVLTRDIERLLNELKKVRAFWKRAALEELKCTDLVWDLLLRATILYADANVALEEARASMRRALAFMNDTAQPGRASSKRSARGRPMSGTEMTMGSERLVNPTGAAAAMSMATRRTTNTGRFMW